MNNTAAALLHAKATAALIESIGMLSDNLQNLAMGYGAKYGSVEFQALLPQYGIDADTLSKFDLAELIAVAVSVAEDGRGKS